MNLFTNPSFTTPSYGLSSGIDEWDGLDSTSTNVNGPEFTSNGTPTGAWLAGGLGTVEGPWGTDWYANKVAPTAGESYTVVIRTSSNAPAINVTLGLGYPGKGGTPPVPLATENVMVADGQPITRVALTAVVPADYEFDGTNGLTVTMHADNASYIRITDPWIGITADAPAEPQEPTVTATGPAFNVGEPIDLQADAVAASLGYSNDIGEVYQFDTVRSSVPAGVTLEWNRAHGTPTEAGAYSLLLFYAQSSNGTTYYRQATNYTYTVGDVAPIPEPVGLDPLAKRVAASLARKGDAATEELASEHLLIVRAFVFGYTRGRGFTEKDLMRAAAPLEAVIVSACMRLTPNPDQLDSYTAGDYSERGATLKGFTLPELAVLNNFRKRMA